MSRDFVDPHLCMILLFPFFVFSFPNSYYSLPITTFLHRYFLYLPNLFESISSDFFRYPFLPHTTSLLESPRHFQSPPPKLVSLSKHHRHLTPISSSCFFLPFLFVFHSPGVISTHFSFLPTSSFELSIVPTPTPQVPHVIHQISISLFLYKPSFLVSSLH